MQAGYNKLNITPKEAVRIAGYNRKELSKGVLDPIEINTLVIKDTLHQPTLNHFLKMYILIQNYRVILLNPLLKVFLQV